MVALSQGKRPVVVRRLQRFGEAVDDHQVQVATQLDRSGRVRAVLDLADLGRAVTSATNAEAQGGLLLGPLVEVVANEVRRAASRRPSAADIDRHADGSLGDAVPIVRRMCGICGVVQLTGEPLEVIAGEVLDRMTDVIGHRGPDDVGTYAAPGIAIGVRRLSIVDVAGGHQPFPNEDGSVWAAQNGRLSTAHRDREIDSAPTGIASRAAATPRSSRTSTKRMGTTPPRASRDVRLVVWDEARRRAASCATGWASNPSTTPRRATGSCSGRS